MTAKAQLRPKSEQQVTFVMQVQQDLNVLRSVVALFDELQLRIDAIWMARGKHAKDPRISVTVGTNPDDTRKIEESLLNVTGVLSLKTRTGETALISALRGSAHCAE